MATTATDVLSVAEARQELRIPQSDTSQDALLTRHISTAVGYISRHTVAPLVDRTVRVRAQVAAADRPVYLRALGLRSVSAVRYWTPAGDFRLDPDGAVTVADLGRTYHLGQACMVVWPVAAGWPDRLENSRLQVDALQGLEIDQETEQLKQAVVVLVRDLMSGYREIRNPGAFFTLIDDFRYRGPVLPEVEVVSAAPGPTPPPVTTHSLYALVTADSATPTAAEFLATTPTTANEIEVPAHGSGYLHFADTRSSLSEIEEAGSAFGSRAFFSDAPTPLSINGVQHYVYSSKGLLFAHNAPQVWELIS